jgi:hypothetical protein
VAAGTHGLEIIRTALATQGFKKTAVRALKLSIPPVSVLCEQRVRKLVQQLGGPLGVALTLFVGAWVIVAVTVRTDVGRSGSLFAWAALLVAGALALAVFHGRSPGALSARGAGGRALVGLLCGALAAVLAAVLAPQGLDPLTIDLVVALILLALGAIGAPLSRMIWWASCGIGLGLFALFGFPLLPTGPGLAGYEEPTAGSDVSVSWSADGAQVSVVYPLDEPVEVINGQVHQPSVVAALDRLGRPNRDCPDADGEERATAEALVSGNRDRAIARARLALQICPQASYASLALRTALLARGVTHQRAGRSDEAVADLERALDLLSDKVERARAHLALGRALEALDRKPDADLHFRRAAALAADHPAGRAAKRRSGGG